MTNRCLLGAGIALAVAIGGVQAHAQLFPYGTPGAWYIGPEGGWTSLTSQSESTSSDSAPFATPRTASGCGKGGHITLPTNGGSRHRVVARDLAKFEYDAG